MKSKAGLAWNDCGGATTRRIVEHADKVKCEGGGTLKDKIDGGGGGASIHSLQSSINSLLAEAK